MNWRAFEMDYNIGKRIAREEGWEEGKEEGRKEGRKEGECKNLIKQVCKKKARGLTPEDAAEQLESDIEQVMGIYAAIDSAENPDDIDMIFEKYIDSHVT